jgi:signal transduction histidine kinase
MLAVLLGGLFISAGMLISIFILLIRPFYLAPKNFPMAIYFCGLVLMVLGVVGNTLVLANLPEGTMVRMLNGEVPHFLNLVPLAFPGLFFIGFISNVIYLASTQKKPTQRDFIFILIPILFSLLMILVFKRSHYNFLGLEGQDQRTAAALISSIVMIYVSALIEIQIKKNRPINDSVDTVLKLVGNFNLALLVMSLIYSIYLVVNFFEDYRLSGQIGTLQLYDLYFRSARLVFIVLIEIMLALHWLMVFTPTAIHERENRKRVQELLLEKDSLIQTLINKQALAETGALAAGLAHELNQYLARIQLNNEETLIQAEQHSMKDMFAPSLSRISQATQSASKLILSIKKLFKKEDQDITVTLPNQLIHEVVNLYQSRLRQSDIQLVMDLNCDVSVEFWDTLIRQVISNIFLNAIEALDGSARTNKKIIVHNHVEDNFFIFSISDNGPGFAQHITDGGLSLFKTTKTLGTGVGLWLSKYIIERHHGKLHLGQSPDGGALVQFMIPLLHPTMEGL